VSNALKTADSNISDASWKNMGEKEYRETLKQFFDEIEKLKPLTDNIGKTLKQLAILSLTAAGVCVVGAGMLLVIASVSVASSFFPGLRVALEAIKLAVARTFSKSLGSIIKNNAMAMGMIATIVMMISGFFTELVGGKLSKAASPTAAGSTPNFEQVVIKGLPTASTSPYTSGLSGTPEF
jgi:hypothetical protein